MITKPIIILGAPRAGTTILQRCLYLHPDLWHLRAESHKILEGPFHPFKTGANSNRVTAADLTEGISEELRQDFFREAINLNRVLPNPAALLDARTVLARVSSNLMINIIGAFSRLGKPAHIRFLEKTPKNTLRASMLADLFPDCYFIALRRSAFKNIDSLLAGWRTVDKIGPIARDRFGTYPVGRQLELVDYQNKWWKFALVPGWQELKYQSLADVAAWQYFQCNRIMLLDLEDIEPGRVYHLKHEDFVENPPKTIRQIFEWAGLPPSPIATSFAEKFPIIGHRRTKEDQKSFRFYEEVKAAVGKIPELENLHICLGYRSLSMD